MSHSSDADDTLDTVPEIQLRIPGPWVSSDVLARALEKSSTHYRLLDGYVTHLPSRARIACTGSEPDGEIAGVFAGGGRITRKEVQMIASHKAKVHLAAPGGSVDAARAVMDATAALLRAGGYGVMVDNSGATHPPRDWFDLCRNPEDPGGAYWAFVAATAGDDEAFTSGMHCLGLRDAEMRVDGLEREAAGFMLHNFLGYALQSGNPILDGDALGDEHSALFRARARPCTRFPAGTPFFNPYGVWSLEPVERDDREAADDEGDA